MHACANIIGWFVLKTKALPISLIKKSSEFKNTNWPNGSIQSLLSWHNRAQIFRSRHLPMSGIPFNWQGNYRRHGSNVPKDLNTIDPCITLIPTIRSGEYDHRREPLPPPHMDSRGGAPPFFSQVNASPLIRVQIREPLLDAPRLLQTWRSIYI
jgi:hypothetical protein